MPAPLLCLFVARPSVRLRMRPARPFAKAPAPDGRPPVCVARAVYSLVLITTWMPLPSSSLANFLASASEPTIAP